MTKVLDTVREELVVSKLKGQPHFLERSDKGVDVREVVLKSFGKDDDVV